MSQSRKPITSLSPFQRRLVVAGMVLALFVVFDLALFSWLFLESLSQREIDRALLDTREDATELAGQLAQQFETWGDDDLFTAIAVDRDTKTYIDQVLLQRDIVRRVEVTDKNGIVVFRNESRTAIPGPAGVMAFEDVEGVEEVDSLQRRTGSLEHRVEERSDSWEVEEAIGEFGFLRIQVDPTELDQRVALLRRDLLRRTGLIGAVTMVVLVLAFVVIWWLLQRARQLEEQAAEAERMAYIGTLAAGLAHEIRNPLNSLSLNMQLLEEELGEATCAAGSSRRLLAITHDEIQRLEHLATDFLSYARSKPLETEWVSARELLESSLVSLGAELRSLGAEAAVEDSSAGVRVQVDPHQIKQLLVNLIKNGLEATRDTGRPPRLTLRALPRAERVVLEVEDNGAGMNAEERRRMFELFFSTRKGGTGLGLGIVERIARAHGAELSVDSEPGAGTRVRLALPVAERQRGDQPATVPTTARGAA